MEDFREISELMGCGLLVFDEEMKVSHASSRAGEIFGSPPDTLLRKPLSEIDAMLRDPQGLVLPEANRVLSQSASRKERLLNRSLCLIRSDGAAIAISLNAAPLRDENGRAQGLVVDFTERNRGEEERLHKFIGAMDEIAFEFDAEGRYLNIWTEDEDLLKRPRRDLLGRKFDEVIPRDLAEKVHSIFRWIQKTGQPETLEYSLEVLGGTRWFLGRIALIPSPEGGQPTFSFLARDITRQKMLEHSLRDSERRFRGLFEKAAIGIALVGLDGWCLEANQYLRDMLGYSLEELRSNPLAMYSQPGDYLLDLGQFELLARGEIDSYSLEKRFIHKDGHQVWGHLTVALERNHLGTPLYGIAILKDITQTKRVEEEKEHLLGELEAIFNSAADGIIFNDEKGHILRMNKAAEEITGYTEKEKKLSFSERYQGWGPRQPDGTVLPLAKSGIDGLFHGKTVKRKVMQFHRPDGKQIWISFSTAPIFDASGRQYGAVSTITDISEVRDLQDRLEDYLHMVAHDLRIPLNVISGHTQILREVLQETPLWERSQMSTEAILNSINQMEQMMEELVEIGQLESGQVILHQDLICLQDFMKDFLHQQISEGYRRVRVKFPEALPSVRFGVHHLERCLGNLIGNALKYSALGTPVEVEASRKNGQVCLVIQDYGKGIAPEELPHIFKRFYRTSSAKGKTGGTGLGLFITKNFIESYGGSIQVQSELGRGTRVTICLPAAACP
jgi:PAS domain S-box-containing protein